MHRVLFLSLFIGACVNAQSATPSATPAKAVPQKTDPADYGPDRVTAHTVPSTENIVRLNVANGMILVVNNQSLFIQNPPCETDETTPQGFCLSRREASLPSDLTLQTKPEVSLDEQNPAYSDVQTITSFRYAYAENNTDPRVAIEINDTWYVLVNDASFGHTDGAIPMRDGRSCYTIHTSGFGNLRFCNCGVQNELPRFIESMENTLLELLRDRRS